MKHFTIRALALLALALFALPAVAADCEPMARPIPGGLWALADSYDGAEYARNIEDNLGDGLGLDHRMPIRITDDGRWRADRGDVLLQFGHTYAGDFTELERSGRCVVLNLLGHRVHEDDGTNYHCSQGGDCAPITDKRLIARFFAEMHADIQARWPGLKIRGLEIFNEFFDYCPNGCPPQSQRLAIALGIWDELIPMLPASWDRIDGGMSLPAGISKQQADARRLILDVHCNGQSVSQCRSKVRDAFEHSSRVGIYENRKPDAWADSRADQFYSMCVEEGCHAYFQMVGRNSGCPPNSVCHWGVRPSGKKNRNGVGFIGCFWTLQLGDDAGVMRRAGRWMKRRTAQLFSMPRNRAAGTTGGQSPPGSFDNWTPLVNMSKLSGAFNENYVFKPMRADSEPPPPSDPVVPGLHQRCAQFSIWLREVLPYDMPVPTPESCKANDNFVRAYCAELARTGAAEQCVNE